MKNVTTLATISFFALTSFTTQATELVNTKPVNTIELVELAKNELTQTLQLNTVQFNPVMNVAQNHIAKASKSIKTRHAVKSKAAAIAE